MKSWILSILCITSLFAGKYEEKLATLYDSLDPNSLTELFAFYRLYADSETGKKAFHRALELINIHRATPLTNLYELELPKFDLDAIVSLATKQSYEKLPTLKESDLQIIDTIASHLANRTLKGRAVWKKEELASLLPQEIDLSRALLLHQFPSPDQKNEILTYEAYLDMMALQIYSRLPKTPKPLQILEGINHFIFHEMRYRFPPHSMWAKDVDLYTFLPSVLDTRHGVCLGVSILYLSLAQRLGLSLTIITPPGHIYLSFEQANEKINIETTARGIHMPDETYLSINTKLLKKRDIKEVIGLNFMNAAATAWQNGDNQKAIELYKEAKIYLPNDPLVNTFLGYNYLLVGDEEKGKEFLFLAQASPSDEFVFLDTITEDYLNGKVGRDGIGATFQEVDETRTSIIEKQERLQKILTTYPKFREGIFHLAITWLQLGRTKEALQTLDSYHELDPNNPMVEYYLTVLSIQRYSYPKAHNHLRNLQSILSSKNHFPKALQSLQENLRKHSPPY